MKTQILNPGNSSICEDILRELPDWFGLEEALQDYTAEAAKLPMVTCESDGRVIGMLTLKPQTQHAVEIAVMGVRPDVHRSGAGRAMIHAAEVWARKQSYRFLTVKTLSAAAEDKNYAHTRAFYEAVGFVHLEEFPDLWDAHNPALMMIKTL